MPPPTRAAMDAEWWGARNGRRFDKAPFARSPATDWIMEISRSSRGVSGGRIEGAMCQHGLSGARWAAHEKIVSTGGGDLERPFRAFLPLDVAKVREETG